MTRIVFESVARYEQRNGDCSVCGKRRTRKLKFEQTVNPFNKNADGSVKTYDEVVADIYQEVLKSRSLPFVCAKCDTTGRANGN